MSVTTAIQRARTRLRLPSTFWPLADQGLVSIGGFIVNLTLARHMAPEDYGVYVLLFMVMLQAQVVSNSLLFYPLSVRGTVLEAAEQASLFGTGLILAITVCMPMGLALAVGLTVAGHDELVAPALAWLCLWQVQELLRRGLFTQMRHAAAIPGDAVRCGGQALALVGLVASGHLTLVHAVTAMAVVAGLAAACQALQFRLAFAELADWRAVALGCIRVGAGSLGSNALSMASMQIYPWSLAAFGGTALAAGFQASVNVVTIVSPVLIGLCNVIPQTVAREARQGSVQTAWHAARPQMALGAAPVVAFYVLAAIWPQPILTALYGHDSPYAALTLPVRAMAAGAILGFGVEMVNAFLHGIQQTRWCVKINATGLAVTLLVGLPLTALMGLAGGCFGMVGANIARSVSATRVLSKMVTHDVQ